MAEFHIISNDTLDSTNDEAKRLIDSRQAGEWTVITAGHQWRGKGLGDNRWESEPGRNLLFSIVLEPEFIIPESQFLLNMALSLGISAALQDYLATPVMIKWPNDLYVGARKIGGLLIQHIITAGRIKYSIAGVGLNVNQRSFPARLPNPVSVAMLLGHEVDRQELLRDVLLAVEKEYSFLRERKDRETKKEYLGRLYLFGEEANYMVKGRRIAAVIENIDRFGRLQLRSESGELITCNLKEVSYPV